MTPYWYPDCKDVNCPVFKKCCFLPTSIFPIERGGAQRVDILFVGQGGGKEEREQIKPFVGEAGKRLRNLLKIVTLNSSIPFGVALSNTIRDNPEKNRAPTIEEIAHCRKYLMQDIQRLYRDYRLQVIVPLGNEAKKVFIDNQVGITKDHGVVYGFQLEDIKLRVIPTYHPSYIIRNKKIFDHNRLHKLEEEFITDILNAVNLC